MKFSQKKQRVRAKVKLVNEKKLNRLVVHKTGSNIYAQLIETKGNGRILAQFSTLNKDFKSSGFKGYNIIGAKFVGEKIAAQIKSLNIKEIVYDRSGYVYHGRIKSLFDAVREGIKE